MARATDKRFAGLRRVLLIDRCEKTRNVRTQFLREHGVEVETAEDLEQARFLWQPGRYNLVLLDARRYRSEELFEYWQQLRETAPRERIAFLLGPPFYLSLTWPYEIVAVIPEKPQWGETVKRFLAAA